MREKDQLPTLNCKVLMILEFYFLWVTLFLGTPQEHKQHLGTLFKDTHFGPFHGTPGSRQAN